MIVIDGKWTMKLVGAIIRKALNKAFGIPDANTSIRKISVFEKDDRFCISLDADIDVPSNAVGKYIDNL